MKAKRILFILSLIVIFIACFVNMNRHYDVLARYPYADESNRATILKYLTSTEDINYLITSQMKPTDFLPFIEEKDFDIRNSLWYTKAKELQDGVNADIVRFINTYRSKLSYSTLETVLKNYSYATLEAYFTKGDEYIKNSTLVQDPANLFLLIGKEESLYRYEPKNLTNVDEIPHVNVATSSNSMMVRSEVATPLLQLCEAASSLNDKTCGDMILTTAYLSYEEQIPLYERYMLKYGHDVFRKYWDYPGQSEYQTGFLVRFQPVGYDTLDNENTEENESAKTETQQPKEQEVWLEENAYKFGFVLRYPKEKEAVTGKLTQPYTLRYVGIEDAKKIHDGVLSIEEYVREAN